jgi:predicted nuclease of predicted toxin-antitoxin system
MHIKVDEDLPVQVVERLRDSGHDASGVLDQNMGGWKDPKLWQAVQAHGQFLVTVTRDLVISEHIRLRPMVVCCC